MVPLCSTRYSTCELAHTGVLPAYLTSISFCCLFCILLKFCTLHDFSVVSLPGLAVHLYMRSFPFCVICSRQTPEREPSRLVCRDWREWTRDVVYMDTGSKMTVYIALMLKGDISTVCKSIVSQPLVCIWGYNIYIPICYNESWWSTASRLLDSCCFMRNFQTLSIIDCYSRVPVSCC